MATNYSTDYDDLTQARENIQTGRIVTSVLCVCLSIVNVCLLLTGLSKQCRAISANWYIYCIHAMIILYGLTLSVALASPTFWVLAGCAFLHNFYHLLQLLYSLAVVMTNIEVYRTIISPRQAWTGSRVKRFTWACVVIMGVCLTIVSMTGALSYRVQCSGMAYFIMEGVMHILKNWIPGFSVIVLFILNIVGYVQLRRRGLVRYNQFVENSPVAILPTEWFICVLAIDIIYLVFEVLFVHMPLVASVKPGYWAFKLAERLLLICLGVPVLALSHVRKTILVFCRRRLGGHGDVVPVATHDTNCDAIEDESL